MAAVPEVSYVYGIVSAGVRLAADTRGVGEPAAEVRLIRHENVAALVSSMDADRPLGLPDDLRAHFTVLNETAERMAVLPLRFGAVMADSETVVDELLAPHHDDFVASLDELDGYEQYLVKGRYPEDRALQEVLENNPEASRLCAEINDLGPDASHDQRVALGELVHACLETLRDSDTQVLLETLGAWTAAVELRDAASEQDAFQVAVLVTPDNAEKLEHAVSGLAREWRDRLAVRLIGPMAPYDFVIAPDA